jgi:aminoacyl-tRNA hydrolase
MKIIAGLGNPGKEYRATRHNIGFEAVDYIAYDLGIYIDERKHKALLGKGIFAGEKVIFLKPQTYMNLSGESIRAALDYYKLTNEDLIVIYDDISLDVGEIRIRTKGSAGGHNGIKSIISHLGTDVFDRIKIGVGDKPKGYDLADYVLGKFKENEVKNMEEAVINAKKALKLMLQNEEEKAMNLFNRKKKEID